MHRINLLIVSFLLVLQVAPVSAQSNLADGSGITIELAPALPAKPTRGDPVKRTQSDPEENASASLDDLVMHFLLPIPVGSDAILGRTIGQVTNLKPDFAPIPGLDETIWKDKSCSACHRWTRADLCTQSKTYLAFTPAQLEEKLHPFGGSFRKVLRNWAGGDCQ